MKKILRRNYASVAYSLVCALAFIFSAHTVLCAQTLDVARLKKVSSLSDISKDKKYAFVSTYEGKLYTLTATVKNSNSIEALCLTDSPESFSETNLFQFSAINTSKKTASIKNCGNGLNLIHKRTNDLRYYKSSLTSWKETFSLNEKADGISACHDEDVAYNIAYSGGNSFKFYSSSGYAIAYLYEYDETNTVGSITILTDEGYGTYYLDKDFVMPEGLKGATISDANETSGELSIDWKYAAGSTVPANTALLVYGTKGTTYTLEAPTETSSVSVRSTTEETNLLRGSVTDEVTSAPGDASADDYYFYQMYYVTKLNEGQKQLGFFWGAEQGGTFTNGAHKAYLALPRASSMSIKGFALPSVDDGTSAIHPVMENRSQAPSVYTLSGKRCDGAILPKGIYIINGKKTIR